MVSLIQILSWFKDGLFVNEEQFKKTWSSFWHKSERLPLSQILGLSDELKNKAENKRVEDVERNVALKADTVRVQDIENTLPTLASKEDLLSVMDGLNPMGDALNMADLETKPKRHKDSYFVLDQLDENGNTYIFKYDEGIADWINTKQVVYKDVAKKIDITNLKLYANNVNDTLKGISAGSENKFNKYGLALGKYVEYDANAVYGLKDNVNSAIVYMYVDPDTEYTLSGVYKNHTNAILFIDDKGNRLGGIVPNWGANSKTFVTPDGCTIIIMTVYYAIEDKIERIKYSEKLQLEKGSVPTRYKEFIQYRELYTKEQADKIYSIGFFGGYYNTATGAKGIGGDYLTIDKTNVTVGRVVSIVNKSAYTLGGLFFTKWKNDGSFASTVYASTILIDSETSKVSASFQIKDAEGNIVLNPDADLIKGLIYLEGIDTIESVAKSTTLSFRNDDIIRLNFRSGYYATTNGNFVTALDYVSTEKLPAQLGKVVLMYINDVNNSLLKNQFISYFADDGSHIGYKYFDPKQGIEITEVNASSFTLSSQLEGKTFTEVLYNVRVLGVENKITKYDVASPLWGASADFDGDSFMFGAISGTNNTPKGWAFYAARDNNLNYRSYARGGAVISNVDWAGGGSLYKRIVVDQVYRKDIDYFIFEGGANDFANLNYRTSMGVITDGYNNEFDTTTILGSLEAICKHLMDNLVIKGTKVGFIINHKIGNNYSIYYDKLKEVLEKWSIPYLDLWNTCSINLNLQYHLVMFGFKTGDDKLDTWHVNQYAYQYMRTLVNAWLKSL